MNSYQMSWTHRKKDIVSMEQRHSYRTQLVSLLNVDAEQYLVTFSKRTLGSKANAGVMTFVRNYREV